MSANIELMIIICAKISATGVRNIDRVEIIPKVLEISGAVAMTEATETTTPFIASRSREFLK
jgi:hypothetical protein